MDCVTTRLQMGIRMFFSVLDIEKCKEIGKIGEILSGGLRTEKKIRENDLKRSSEIKKFPRKNVEICWVVREPRQNLSSGPRVGKG